MKSLIKLSHFLKIVLVSGTGPTNGENHEDDDEDRVMNNLMSDIHAGFVHRRLPDGGFKVSGR